jgi:Cupin-like domain
MNTTINANKATESCTATNMEQKRSKTAMTMTMTTMINTMGPLLAVVTAIVLFHFHHSGKDGTIPMEDNVTEPNIYVQEWDIDPNPTSSLHIGKDRCSIERINETDMTYTRFVNEYWRRKPIILVRDPHVNRVVQTFTTKHNMMQQFATQSIPIAGVEAYAFREEQTKSFSDYLDQLSNNAVPETTIRAKHINFNFGIDQYGVGDHYIVPTIINFTAQSGDQHSFIEQSWHYQVAIAGYGVGLPFHWHGDVLAEVLHGVRRWFIYPPNVSPQFNPRTSSQQWFNDVYLPLKSATHGRNNDTNHLLECTMYPNEALYVPADWFHATLSLGEAVSLTTSFAQQYRHERYKIYDSGSADHAYMIDAMEKQNFTGAVYHAQQLVNKYRSDSFVPYSWLGVIYTLQTQSLQSEIEVMSTLNLGKSATEQCIKLNPYYAPCHVWYSRQLQALSHVAMTTDEKLATEYKHKANVARQAAANLSSENDDELLDPRWQPKKKKSMKR